MKIEMTNLGSKIQHDILGGIVIPLPITLISTVGTDGINAAPFSLVMPVSWDPPVLGVSTGLSKGQKKHTVRNIEETGDCVVNIMDEKYIRPTVRAAANYPSNVNEIERVGLTSLPANRVKSPLITEAQVSIECKLVNEITLNQGENQRTILFIEALLAHIKDELLAGDKIDPTKMQVIGRAGQDTYCRTTDVFRLTVSKASAHLGKAP